MNGEEDYKRLQEEQQTQRFIIWSEEHHAWWRGTKQGYTRSIFDAGRFTQREAHDIVKSGNAYLDPSCDPPLNEIAIEDPLSL